MKDLDSINNDENMVLSSLITFMAHESPLLENLNRDDLKYVAKAVMFDGLKDALAKRVLIEQIDYKAKKAIFLDRAEKRSKSTYKSYQTALEALESWCERSGKHVLELKPKDADSFIDSLDGSSSTIRLRTAACSSFFSFLERETENRIKNPFRGTKNRPIKRTKEPEVPSVDEIELIKQNVSPVIQAAIVVMVEHGLRVGALPEMTVRAGCYHVYSKGKEATGRLADKATEAILKADLDIKKPFAGLNDEAIQNAFKYAVAKLYKADKIKAKYSVHDLRHYFAINEYRKNKDIYRLKTLLNHASIQVTELYLKGIERYIQY